MSSSSPGGSRIESIVFDIGRVLVDFSYDPFAGFLVAHGAEIESREEFVAKTELLKYESGALTTDQFLENVSSLLRHSPEPAALIASWQQIFEPITEMIAVVKGLRSRYRLFLMSNTNELHWSYLRSQFGLLDLVDGAVVSYQVGMMKPQPGIFAAAAAQLKLTPQSTLLIDDVAEHVAAAQHAGWNGLHHRDPKTTQLALAKLGITLPGTP